MPFRTTGVHADLDNTGVEKVDLQLWWDGYN